MVSNRMVDMFETLVGIESISGKEKEIHQYLKEVFQSLDLEVVEDGSMEKTKLGADNMIVTLKGESNKPPLLFSAHTDTVIPGSNIKVIENNGILYSKGETILAADDKAGIAIMIEAIKRIKEQNIVTGDLEFVLSPGEEIGLIGASALDWSLIKSKKGFVLDSAGSVGRVTVASPTLYMYEVVISGKAAHAGLEPEKGISAVSILTEALPHIRIGRIDDVTTANIGVIQGGEATNIVMNSLFVKGEIRSVSIAQTETLLSEMKAAFRSAAEKFSGQVSVTVKKMATGFQIDNDKPVMKLLEKAAENLAYEVTTEVSGGGSDANVFNENNIEVVNLSIGYEKIHTTEEFIPIVEMEKAVHLVMELAKMAPSKEG